MHISGPEGEAFICKRQALSAPDPVVALLSTLSRWRDRQTGQLLVAVALKDDDGVRMVLPIEHHRAMSEGYQAAHPFDWMPEASFLRRYELASPSQTEGAGP